MASGTSLPRLLRPSVCSSCRQSIRNTRIQRASLSSSAQHQADGGDKRSIKPKVRTDDRTSAKPTQPDRSATDVYSEMRGLLKDIEVTPRSTRPQQSTNNLLSKIGSMQSMVSPQRPGAAPAVPASAQRPGHHHLHIYAHKHNTHIVLTRPNREPILSYSAGNIGFRKAQRGSFDAAFQLAAYVMRTISDKGLLRSMAFSESGVGGVEGAAAARKLEAPIRDLEVVLRGFGKGREAVTKALLGAEGRFLREKIKMVSDDTKLKFGGTRSPNPRRLG